MNKNIPEILKKGFFFYQKSMWYAAQAGGEISKPARFINETMLFVLVLKTIFGINISLFAIISIYIAFMILAVILGIFLCKIGIVKFNTTLSNNHNSEIMEILKRIKGLEKNARNRHKQAN